MPVDLVDFQDSSLVPSRDPQDDPEPVQGELERILPLLSDHMWIHIDDIATARLFGFGLDAISAAQKFAAKHNCIFVPDLRTNSGRFGRANQR